MQSMNDNDDNEIDFSLTKGIKIWMAFNRECYFFLKTTFLII